MNTDIKTKDSSYRIKTRAKIELKKNSHRKEEEERDLNNVYLPLDIRLRRKKTQLKDKKRAGKEISIPILRKRSRSSYTSDLYHVNTNEIKPIKSLIYKVSDKVNITSGTLTKEKVGKAVFVKRSSLKNIYPLLLILSFIAVSVILMSILNGLGLIITSDENISEINPYGDDIDSFTESIAALDETDFEYSTTGDSDLLKVAMKELGNGGNKYYTWYGFSSRVSWCACFVSWCSDRAGLIKEGKVPKFSLVQNGLNWFKDKNRFKNRNYAPNTGDIIFFDWDYNGIANHVGIVRKVKSGKVYTVEGNSSDRVRERSYPSGSSFIMGYGSI